MLDLLNSYIIYSYNDMSIFIVQTLGMVLNKNFFLHPDVTSSLSLIDILSTRLAYFFFNVFPVYAAMNLIGLIYLILNFIITYLLFLKLVRPSSSKVMSFMFALFYATSNYFLFRIASFTPNLYPVFIFPLVIYLLQIKKVPPFLLGIILTPMFFLSAYYGFFSLLVIGSWYFFDSLILKEGYVSRIKNLVLKILLLLLPIAIFILVFLLPLVKLNQSIPFSTPTSTKVVAEPTSNTLPGIRPIDDYYNMSFRPWYFIIPPNNSLFFGDFSKSIYKQIHDTGYYLADDYSDTEAGGSYIGWHLIITTLIISYLLLFKYKDAVVVSMFSNVFNNRISIYRYAFIILILLLLSHPPSFTISGYTLYTPSYLLYYIAPAFRGLVRLSGVIYLFLLLINYYFILDMYYLFIGKYLTTQFSFKSRLFKLFPSITFIVICIIIHYYFMLIKVPLVNTNQIPKEIEYLSKVGAESPLLYAVYPKGDYKTVFWITKHGQTLVNPSDLRYMINEMTISEFTKMLPEDKGVTNLKELGVNYLVIYKNKITIEEYELINFKFGTIDSVEMVYDDENAVIFKINSMNP